MKKNINEEKLTATVKGLCIISMIVLISMYYKPAKEPEYMKKYAIKKEATDSISTKNVIFRKMLEFRKNYSK